MMTYESTPAPTPFVIGRVTDAGRSGKNNEDYAETFQARLVTQQNGNMIEMPIQVAVVADGIGGNVAGETASRMAVEGIKDFFRSREQMAIPDRLAGGLIEANRQIYERAAADPALSGMGTTVVAAAIVESRLYVVHAGDSRAYLLRNGQLLQLTLDHTWAQEAIEAGRLTPAAAKDHPNRHVIKRFLGISEVVDVDSAIVDINHSTLDPEQIHTWPKTDSILLQPGDAIVLCTDGLTDVVSDERIKLTISRYAPQEAAQRLVDQANKAGGPDNITVVVIQWSDGTSTVAAQTRKRSPIVAAVLVAALLLVAGAAGYVLATNNGAKPPSTDMATAPGTENPIGITLALTATLITAEPTATLTAIETSTALPSPTSSPLPTETATAAVTATDPPPTSTPQPDTVPSTPGRAGNSIATIAVAGSNNVEEEAAAMITMLATTPTERATLPATAGSTGAAAATSTPIPDFTFTPTLTPQPTPSVTPTAQAAKTPVVTVAASRVAISAPPVTNNDNFTNASVILLEPSNGDTVSNARIFSWQANFELLEGYAFEPIFWSDNQNPMISGAGYGGTTIATSKSLSAEDLIKVGARTGDYYWGVLLVTTEPDYKRIKYLGGGNRVRIEGSSTDSEDQGGGNRPD